MDEQEWPQTPAKVRKAMEGLDKQPLLGGCGSWRRYQEQSQVVDQIVGPESRDRPARSRREAHETWGAATCTRSTEEGYAPAKTLVKKETRYLVWVWRGEHVPWVDDGCRRKYPQRTGDVGPEANRGPRLAWAFILFDGCWAREREAIDRVWFPSCSVQYRVSASATCLVKRL
ncbi:hypothetical protein FDECE_17285 [Fusarium decemcellulare]|nr:hypothetical protein FDECE_17285 [Fusarium decemcellulare]